MEEHIWFLVELFISGRATDTEASELAYLLGTHPDLLSAVKEFLNEYHDPDPQVTPGQKRSLLARAESIHHEKAFC